MTISASPVDMNIKHQMLMKLVSGEVSINLTQGPNLKKKKLNKIFIKPTY